MLSRTSRLSLGIIHRVLLHFGRQRFSEVFLDPRMHQVDNRRHEDGDEEFVNVIPRGSHRYLVKAPFFSCCSFQPRTYIKRDEQHYEAVDQLRYERGSCGAQPDLFFACVFFYAMENENIQHLRHEL